MDIIKSFLLEDGLFRGAFIAADGVTDAIWEKHGYPDKLRPIFSEAVVMALALSAGIKYDGVFSLQIKGNGPVLSLFVDVTTDKKVRGYIVFDAEAVEKAGETITDLFGQGQLIFSVAAVGQEPYQGVIALNKNTLTEVVADYFALSEQIKTDIIMRQKKGNVRCLMIQQLPQKEGVSPETAADLWETVQILAGSVQNQELFSEKLTPDEMLFRLFHANKLMVFPAKTPVFECRCYRGRMETFLKKMNALERASLYQNGQIDVVCQFCGEKYSFTPDELGDASLVGK